MIDQVFKIDWKVLRQPRYWVVPLVLAAILIVLLQFSFHLFHITAEGITIIVAGMMVATAWQTYDLTHNRFFTLLGYGFFCSAIIDFAHTVTYKGMQILPITSANAATQLWVGARYVEALVLFGAMLFLHRLPNPRHFLIVLGIATLTIIATVFGGIFPDAYLEPEGLTPFKIISEYVIMGVLAATLLLLGHRRQDLPRTVVAPLGVAVLASIVSEFAFTIYVDVFDLSNIFGHIMKMVAFWFVFIAIVRTTLAEPFLQLRLQTELQKRTARDLQESEERLRSIMQSTQDAIVMIDDDGNTIFWNKSAEEMFGYSESEALGQPVHDLLAPPEEYATIMKRLAEFASTGTGPVVGRTVNLDARHKSGRTIEVELSVSAVHAQGRWAAIAVVRDVTQRNEAERQLRQLQKSEAVENMAAGIAHDFKNMLLPIITLTNMCLKNMPEGSRDRTRLEKVLEAANRAADLAKRILDFASQDTPEVTDVDLSALTNDAIELLCSTLLSTITIEDHIEPNLMVCADAGQLHTVIINIANNAADAMEGRTGKIRIELVAHTATESEAMAIPIIHVGRQYAKLTITDDGMGMNDTTLARIFDPYFTLKAVGKGTGLGLSVAHNIITRHNGAIYANSEVDVGTTFTILLPLHDPNAPAG